MANKKFSEFVLKTSTSDVSHIVGYNGAENVQITPANFVTGGGTGVFLPLAGGTMVGNTIHNDNVKSIYGTSGDGLEIFHDGSNSYINDTGTGDLYIRGTDNIYIQDNSTTERFITCNSNASVDLFYNDSLKFSTTSTGISVTGDGLFTGDVIADTHFNSSDSNATLSTTGAGNVFLRPNGKSVTTGQMELVSSGDASFTGNVGIGNSSTSSFLSNGNQLVVGSGSVSQGITIYSDSTGTGNLFFADGTTGDEAYKGFLRYNHSDDSMLFYTNGANERMRLDSSGNLALGISSTSGIRLYVQGGSGVSARFLRNGSYGEVIEYGRQGVSVGASFGYPSDNVMTMSTGGQERVRIDASGNVGVGSTDSPNVSGFPSTTLTVEGVSGQYGAFELGSASQTTSGGRLGEIRFYNKESSSPYGFASIRGLRGSSAGSSDLSFFTSSSNVGSERMRLDASGNLGVGGNPNRKLHCYGQFAISNAADTGALLFITETTSNQIYSRAGNASSTALPLRFMMGGQEKMRLTTDGDLLVGKTAIGNGVAGAELRANGQCVFTADGDNALDLNRLTNDGAVALFRKAGTVVGSISVTGSATAYNTSSDYRLKEDLQDFKGLDLVSKIPVYDYKWKSDKSRSYGVMAHELEEVLPQAVSGEKDAEEMQSVDYSKIVPLLVKSIQELSAKLEALECQCEKK